MNKQKLAAFAVAAGSVVGLAVAPVAAQGGPPRDDDGNRLRAVVYVESQGLFYETIVGPAVAPEGPFQELRPGAGPDGSLATDFGPGDPGYVGGRWWVDANGNGEMDEHDAYFSCPLLGKGSTTHP